MSTRVIPQEATTASTAPLASLFQSLAPQMRALDDFIRLQVEQFEPEIRPMAAYCLESTGKRLRPSMVFITGWKGEGVVEDPLVRAAGVVEMVHLATLVHDDIMDRAEIRRNRRTAAREFGPDAAVLLGDALFSQALHIASQFPSTAVCRMVTLEEYRRIIDLKTAELFRVSCYLGASLGGYDEAFARAADEFGRHLGIAYQIYDDLADFLGEESHIGKTLGTDLATGKLTLPLMLLLQKVPGEERASIVQALRAGSSPALATSKLRMAELGIAQDVVQAIDDELASAEAKLVPHLNLPPIALMRQLCQLLKNQVNSLSRLPGPAA
jgi:octaprenyl-diphosphate synthase